jgi:2-methylcitrate dehydratase PrpD
MITEQLASYACGLTYDRIPGEVTAYAKTVILDSIGTWLAGSADPVGQRMIAFTEATADGGPCSVIGTATRTSTITAAFANATISHCLELDDNYNPANAHVANVVVPAALAVAEARQAGGRALIAAIVAAYDVEGRIGITLDPVRLYERSFHPSSVAGNFGAAAAATSLLELDTEQTVNALGLAGCQASGLLAWVTEPAQSSKSFQIGIAARNGVTAAELAKLGFTGPPHILEGNHNVFRAFTGEWDPAELTKELGSRFEIARTSLKKYAACRQIHAPLDSLFQLMRTQQLTAADIDRIQVRVPTSMASIIDGNELPSHSAQYVLATAAVDGRIDIDQLTGDRLREPQIAALARGVTVDGDDDLEALFPEQWPGAVTITTADGREVTHTTYYPTGDPENPMSEDDVQQKFLTLATMAIDSGRAGRIIDLVDHLEDVDDSAELVALCAGDRRVA